MPKPANKPIIAVDIDDVIAAHAPAFVEYTNHKFGTNLTIEDYHDHWGEVWKVDHEETEKRATEYHTSGFIASYGVISGAKEVLKKLKPSFRLVIITTRRRSIDKLTEEWISNNYADIFDEIIFAGFFDTPGRDRFKLTKAELVKKHNASYLIDDQPKHCISAAEVGINSLLFGDYPWSRDVILPAGVTRVKNWKEVLEYFDGRS